MVKTLGISQAARLCEAKVKIVRGHNERRILTHEIKAFMKYYSDRYLSIDAKIASLEAMDEEGSACNSTYNSDRAGKYVCPQASVSCTFISGHVAILRNALAECSTQLARGRAAFCKLGEAVELATLDPESIPPTASSIANVFWHVTKDPSGPSVSPLR